MAFHHLTVEEKINSAKFAIMNQNPFFATILINLDIVETTDPNCNTMATDGYTIFWSRDFTSKLKKDEMIFVLCHELLHCALMHHARMANREHKRWNAAADYVINYDLVECKVGTMPKGGLYDKQYAGLSAEEVYNMLPVGFGKKAGGDPGGCGQIIPSPAKGKAQQSEEEARWRQITRQAANIANRKMAGNMPASMKRLIDHLLEPVVDWRSVLRRFIDDNATVSDFSWMRPNRRYLDGDFTMPGMIKEGISHLIVGVDTSGSIGADILMRFASEIAGALDDGIVDKITVFYADTEISSRQEFERGDDVVMKATGGGGTAFGSAMAWVGEQDANACIFFTDLAVYDFGQSPPFPTLWAVPCDSNKFKQLQQPPFGELLHVKEVA